MAKDRKHRNHCGECPERHLKGRGIPGRIARLGEENTEINDTIRRLENGLMLNDEEQLKLTKEVHNLLKEED